jgi:hypothetical protein
MRLLRDCDPPRKQRATTCFRIINVCLVHLHVYLYFKYDIESIVLGIMAKKSDLTWGVRPLSYIYLTVGVQVYKKSRLSVK